MLAYPITFTGPCSRILWTLLLLVVSLNAHNQKWDNPRCTEVVSAPRGNYVEMSCNISNTFRDITIELTANGKTMTIFNKKPPGNYSNDSWQLQIQGGQAQLVITDAQNIHAGSYLWQLNGCQRRNMHLILNVTEPQDQEGVEDLATANQDPESLQVSAESPSAVSTEVTIIVVFSSIIITGISAFAWYKCSHLLRRHRFEVPRPGLNHKFPGIPYLTLPKISQVLPQKVPKGPCKFWRAEYRAPQLAMADNPSPDLGQVHRNPLSPSPCFDPGTPREQNEVCTLQVPPRTPGEICIEDGAVIFDSGCPGS